MLTIMQTKQRQIIYGLLFLALGFLMTACGGSTDADPFQAPGPTVDPDQLQGIESHIEPLTYGLDEKQITAQRLALNEPDLLQYAQDYTTGAALRTAVFGVYPARESDITEESAACNKTTCYRVDVYNYANNTSYSVMVDVNNEQVVHVNRQPHTQPELPPHLTQLALKIATTAPEVEEALGFKPAADDPTMPNVKTALNNTACERSRHLCTAPTFLVDDRALWAIVDLTDEKLVGVRWTDLGEMDAIPTERNMQSEDVFARFCQSSTPLSQGDWEMDFMLTSSDGLRLSDVRFQGQSVLRSVKLADWHVSYSSRDGFGYSDAVGCPMFSSAAVAALDGPTIEPIEEAGQEVGFRIVQDYAHPEWPKPCNYRYQEWYEFYHDGRFRITAANLGRGCGNDGTYRPLLRIDLAPPETGGHTFAEWDGRQWVDWENEGWQLQDDKTLYTAEGFQYQVRDSQGGGYFIEPGQGQFPFGERGDHAFTYVTNYKAGEGDADLLTLGPCCNEDYEQGPDIFIDNPPEPIIDSDLTLWYVPQIENDDTPGQEYCWAEAYVENGAYQARVWPCAAGPMFVPISDS